MIHRALQPVFFLLIFLCGVQVVWSETSHTSSIATIEFTQPLHFLGVDGTDVVIQPGTYQVEAAEAWLKLVPEGKSRSTSVLLEAIRGPHEEEVIEPIVRTISDPDRPDVLHVALLMPDGVGMEAVGTVTGIRPRGLNFAFVARTNRTQTLTSRPGMHAPQSGAQTQAPAPGPKGQPVDCGPYQKRVGKKTRHSPALAVFQNALHLVTSNLKPPPSGISALTTSGRLREASPLKHWIYSNGEWNGGTDIGGTPGCRP